MSECTGPLLFPRTLMEAGSGSCIYLRAGYGVGDQLGGRKQIRMVRFSLCHADFPNSASLEATRAMTGKPEGFLPEQADTTAIY